MSGVYGVYLNPELATKLNIPNYFSVEADNSMKAVKDGFLKLGYKIKLRRVHDYTPQLLPADVMTQRQFKTSQDYKKYTMNCYYVINTMIQLNH